MKWSDMTDEQKRVEIAKLCGIDISSDGKWSSSSCIFHGAWKTSVDSEPIKYFGPTPDYLHSLDACADFRKHMDVVEMMSFNRHLLNILHRNVEILVQHAISDNALYAAINATPAQRCLAFWRAKGGEA